MWLTYIQSGNIIFKTNKTTEVKLEQTIKAAIEKTFGFDVPVLVLSKKELQQLVDDNPYKDRELELKLLHFTLLSSPPQEDKIKLVQQWIFLVKNLQSLKEWFTYVSKWLWAN